MKDETVTYTDAPEWSDPADEAHAVEQAKSTKSWDPMPICAGSCSSAAYR